MYWTTTEIQLLLEVTLQYKEEKSRQNIDWRSHTSTYHDIWKAFLQVYPVKRAEEGVMHFPHDVERINKAKVIFRLMEMRRKFHKQMDTRNFNYGFWDICEKIWGEKEPCDVPGVEQAPVDEEEEVEEEEDSEDTCSPWESESRDWSSTESEDETEMLTTPCKRRLFEENAIALV
uniref:Uncharacterized protein n=1 Tax=Knipowitschia caucasica TaxID=637954 RepID=A0AAV2IWQ0_KNICA